MLRTGFSATIWFYIAVLDQDSSLSLSAKKSKPYLSLSADLLDFHDFLNAFAA